MITWEPNFAPRREGPSPAKPINYSLGLKIENLCNKIKFNFFFFPFVFSLVSFAHSVYHAEALHLALQTRVPCVKRCRHLRLVGCGSSIVSDHLNPRWRRQAVCRDAAPVPGTAIWNLSSTRAPDPRELRLLLAEKNPTQKPCPQPVRESIL